MGFVDHPSEASEAISKTAPKSETDTYPMSQLCGKLRQGNDIFFQHANNDATPA
jgi:hypothetical protein